jgi:RNA polymerase sigma factor (sigma-70 family)
MGDRPETSREGMAQPWSVSIGATDANAWFVREVLPLEAALLQFLHNNWRNESEIEDLLQDIYVRVHTAASKQVPESTKSFVFATARHLLVDRVRHERIVPIDAIADPEMLGIARDEPGPDRRIIARDELRRLQVALDRLPPRCREAIMLRQIEGLSRREIAARMNIGPGTVKDYLAEGVRALADMFYADPADIRRRK